MLLLGTGFCIGWELVSKSSKCRNILGLKTMWRENIIPFITPSKMLLSVQQGSEWKLSISQSTA